MCLTDSQELLPPDSNYLHVYFTMSFMCHADIKQMHRAVDQVMYSFAKESEILKDCVNITVTGVKYSINYSYFLKWRDLKSQNIHTPAQFRSAIGQSFRGTILGMPDAIKLQTQLSDDYHHFLVDDWANKDE